jgi:hypothetical protein
MFSWMRECLLAKGLWTATCRAKLAKTFFHACVLRAVDMNENSLAYWLTREAVSSGVLTATGGCRIQTYITGRCLRSSRRLTFFWNRLARRSYLKEFFTQTPGTYGTDTPPSPESEELLKGLLRTTSQDMPSLL